MAVLEHTYTPEREGAKPAGPGGNAGMPDLSRDQVQTRPSAAGPDNVLPPLAIDGLDGIKGQQVLSETKYASGQKDFELGNGNHVTQFAPGDADGRVAEVTSQGGHVHQTKYSDGHVEKTDDRRIDSRPDETEDDGDHGHDIRDKRHREKPLPDKFAAGDREGGDAQGGDKQKDKSAEQGGDKQKDKSADQGGESQEEEIKNPDGTRIRTGPDGVRKEYPDGRAEITSPDGTVTIKQPEETHNPDGTVSKTCPYDGRKETNGYGADDPRESQTEYPNGRKEIHYKNGNSETQFEPNDKEGRVSEAVTDGGHVTTTKFKDGHTEKVDDRTGDITKSYPPKNGKPGYNVVISKDAQGNTTVTREPYEEIAADPKKYEDNAK